MWLQFYETRAQNPMCTVWQDKVHCSRVMIFGRYLSILTQSLKSGGKEDVMMMLINDLKYHETAKTFVQFIRSWLQWLCKPWIIFDIRYFVTVDSETTPGSDYSAALLLKRFNLKLNYRVDISIWSTASSYNILFAKVLHKNYIQLNQNFRKYQKSKVA